MIAELSWNWEYAVGKNHRLHKDSREENSKRKTMKAKEKEGVVNKNERTYFHPQIPLWQKQGCDSLFGKPQDESLFWFIVLEERGGFLTDTVFDT
jgi:hypothetical protein